MKRLLASSLFWNAVVASVVAVMAYQITEGSEFIVTGIFSLFGLRSLATGGSDLVKANKGVVYDKELNKEVLIQDQSIKKNLDKDE